MHNLAELAPAGQPRPLHRPDYRRIGVGRMSLPHDPPLPGSPDYIKISCGNLPENLWNQSCSAMRPALTGANRTGKRGIFELAETA